MSDHIYGVLDSNDCHIDISRNKQAAKRWATMNGYSKVSIRFNAGYTVAIVAEKVNDKWVNSDD